jgi:hypothetical protein
MLKDATLLADRSANDYYEETRTMMDWRYLWAIRGGPADDGSPGRDKKYYDETRTCRD